MSGRTPPLSAQAVIAALERGGFNFVSQRGSHIKLKNAAGRSCVVPNHREIMIGTLGSILRQAGLTRNEFLHLLDPKTFPAPPPKKPTPAS